MGIIILVFVIIIVISVVGTGVQSLREKYKEEKGRRNSDLLNAVARGDLQDSQKLIKKGANVNCVVSYNDEKRTALQVAAENGYKDMVLLLLEKGADVNLYHEGMPPLDFAQDDEIKAILRERGGKSQSELEEAYQKGEAYFYGEGVAQDYKKAVEWYTKAVDAGHSIAKNNLALCYLEGLGVEKNIDKGFYLCKEIAEQEYANAQYMLGTCYNNGLKVSQNLKKAVELYTKSAEQGFAPAQNALGDCYRHGRGVDMNPITAADWYTKAAKQGHADALNNLDELRRESPALIS